MRSKGKPLRRDLNVKSPRKRFKIKPLPVISPQKSCGKRYRPGIVALREIRRCQRSVENYISRRAFSNIVSDIVNNSHPEEYIIEEEAINALQAAGEDYLVQIFTAAQRAAIHAKRVTVRTVDIQFVISLMR